jgi:hypothetical protein
MIERPCKPDADVKWLWRTLLPNMPLPACETANDQSLGPTDEEAVRSPHARERAGRWHRKFWSGRFQSK